MAKKVYELAREMNVKSKDLIGRAKKLGIDLKSHMSTLTEGEEKRIRAGGGPESGLTEEKTTADLVTRPAKTTPGTAGLRRRLPIGRPRVDKEYLAKREETGEGEPAEKSAEPKTAAQTVPAQPVSQPAEAKKPAHVPGREEETSNHPSPVTKEARPEEDRRPITDTQPGMEKEPKKEEAQKKEIGTQAVTSSQSRPADRAESSGKPVSKVEAGAADRKARPAVSPDKRPEMGSERLDRKRPVPTGQKPVDTAGPHAAPTLTELKPRIKIISRAADRKKEEEATRTTSLRTGRETGRPGTGRRTEGRPDGMDRGQRSGRRREDGDMSRAADSRRRPAVSRDGVRSSSEHGPGKKKTYTPKHTDAKRKGGRREAGKPSKFEKLERRSLEKQTRTKHSQYKTAAAPTEERIEEILPEGTIVLTVPITVAGFAEQTEVSTSKVIMTLMKMGIMANINQTVDEDTVMILADELGISVHIGSVEEETEEAIEIFEDKEEDLRPRPPVITVMGHVDHGKTSLLDAIRKTHVTAGESGGITQHIGASEVSIKGQRIVFLDTPGHEAFTAMRARGAHITDIAVLVVAADDGVMPQTIESIHHAKAAGVPIIVAINKMDKADANPDRVKKELADQGVLVEDWGGEAISVPVSAKTGAGIDTLLEMILLQAEMLELRANPNRLAMGSVIEASLDKAKGPVASLLVMNGTLETGQSLVCGTCSGRIRLMTDYKGRTIRKAGPATAVEILGLTDVPQAGDAFNAVTEDRIARDIAAKRKEKLREEVLAKTSGMSLEQLFSKIKEGETKELNLIIKGDVQGSIGALVSSLEKLNNEEVKVNIIHTGVGTVNESDVMLAGTSQAVIIGFNVRPSGAVQSMADREKIEIRTYRVIYDVIDDVEAAMKGLLAPEFKEEILGKVEIKETFKVPGIGLIGGAYVTEGKILRNADIRLVRDGIVIHEGKISSLKRFKDDVKEVARSYECGIGIENYNDIAVGDIIECFHMVEVERQEK